MKHLNHLRISQTKIDGLILDFHTHRFTPDPPLTPELVTILNYFMKIECLVPVTYAPQLRLMPVYRNPKFREFIDNWSTEEAKHGEVLKLYLRRHKQRVSPIVVQEKGWSYKLQVLKEVVGSWYFQTLSTGLYLIIGGANEATTSAGYWAMMKHAENYPLLKKIIIAIQAEEVQHLNFYINSAKSFLAKDKHKVSVKNTLQKYWQPIGSRHDDVSLLVKFLIADNSSDGFYPRLQTYLKKVDDILPGIGEMMLGSIRQIQQQSV